MTEPVYIIGIDLGTTNSIVAFTRADSASAGSIRIFRVPQLVDAGVVENRDILPSFIYIPASHELPEEDPALPWDSGNQVIIGEFARKRGEEVPNRLVASSKSWLCNTLVDRNKPILPWDAPEEVSRMSPVQSSSLLLDHIRRAWNHEMAAVEPELRMEHQDVFLTVPASFDAVARELTVQAAEAAGLSNITLLEEPQAGFYSWIEASGDKWRENVEKGDRVLVCDIGGGTTDFSLIRVSEDDGELALERIAVGEHLLVGGDNMDLALAYMLAGKMAKSGNKLDSWQIRGLVHSCRSAKEQILSSEDMQEAPVTVLGRGSSLIGGTMRTSLSREDLEGMILDGFFPSCRFDEAPQRRQQVGLQEAGLSYESDPAVTRHMAKFLGQQQGADDDAGILPTAILFNGGVMKPEKVRGRILEVLASWREPASGVSLRSVAAESYDLAVARGAAYYGLARRGEGIRIRGGLNRTYYVGIAASMPAVPGMPAPVKALCVAPFGMEAGTWFKISDQAFTLVVGEPVRFDFMGSTTRQSDTAGSVIEDWHGDIEEITTMETTLEGSYGTPVRVQLETQLTEVGTLELWCASLEDGRRWKLEFNVREQEQANV
ncbi:MAG: Hsp70 family protein [Desulfosalsimonadaceae bacterium]